jgi:hypothetical protein
MVPPRNICKVGVYIGEKGESHGVRLARGDRQTGGHGMRRCSLCPLRVCMCVSNTYADNSGDSQGEEPGSEPVYCVT